MSDTWEAAMTQLEALTLALQTALLAEDIATFVGLVRGRGPLIDACMVAWQALAEAERAEAEARLRGVLNLDALLVQSGEAWLRTTRKRLIVLQTGIQASARYGSPLRMQ